MSTQHVLSIDIGSTYTKGILLACEPEGRLRVVARASTPTTVAHLAEGFEQVRADLLRAVPKASGSTLPRVFFSSSARGGLSIAAIGIVPELTLRTARLTALSAGGKVTSVHAYKLTRRDVEALEQERPEIILLAGGTDGGNETYVRHNVAMLEKSTVLAERAAVIYAGNEVLADEVQQRLSTAGFDVRLAPNILPEVDRVAPEGARERIREVFLQRIVHGKGLDEIIAATGAEPLPTPMAVLSLVEAIRRRAPGFGSFLLVDMGGATTDVYSSTDAEVASDRVVYRGIRDPLVKRTVEGDLGMRVSAATAALSAEDALPSFLGDGQEARTRFDAFVARVTREPDYLPDTAEEARLDGVLASACIHLAIRRHAGTWRRVFTAAGETFIQSGKDLRSVRKLIGSGGYLAAMDGFVPVDVVDGAARPAGETIPLLPTRLSYYRDRDYLVPLLGNLVGAFEEAAVQAALEALVEQPRPAVLCGDGSGPGQAS